MFVASYNCVYIAHNCKSVFPQSQGCYSLIASCTERHNVPGKRVSHQDDGTHAGDGPVQLEAHEAGSRRRGAQEGDGLAHGDCRLQRPAPSRN